MTTVTCLRNQRHGDVYLGALTKKGPAERFCVQTLKSYPLFLVFSQRAFCRTLFVTNQRRWSWFEIFSTVGYMSVCVSCQHTISQAHARIYIQVPPFFLQLNVPEHFHTIQRTGNLGGLDFSDSRRANIFSGLYSQACPYFWSLSQTSLIL